MSGNISGVRCSVQHWKDKIKKHIKKCSITRAKGYHNYEVTPTERSVSVMLMLYPGFTSWLFDLIKDFLFFKPQDLSGDEKVHESRDLSVWDPTTFENFPKGEAEGEQYHDDEGHGADEAPHEVVINSQPAPRHTHTRIIIIYCSVINHTAITRITRRALHK